MVMGDPEKSDLDCETEMIKQSNAHSEISEDKIRHCGAFK